MIKRLAMLTLLIVVSAIALLGTQNVAESQCSLLATKGTVQWIRVNEVGTGYGKQTDFIDGEVIFKLTNGTNKYGFKLRENANALVAQGALSLLQESMRTGWNVEVDYSNCDGVNHEVGFYRIRLIKP